MARGSMRYGVGLLIVLVAVGLFAHPNDARIDDFELATHLESARALAFGEAPLAAAGEGPARAARPPGGTWLLSALFATTGEARLRSARYLGMGLGLLAFAVVLALLARLHGVSVAWLAAALLVVTPAFLVTFRTGGRGAMAAFALLLTVRPPCVGSWRGRAIEVGALGLASLSVGLLALPLVWLLRLGTQERPRLSAGLGIPGLAALLVPLLVWSLVAPSAASSSWLATVPLVPSYGANSPLVRLATLAHLVSCGAAFVILHRGVSPARDLCRLAVALSALLVLFPPLREPWALAVLPLPAVIVIARALQARLGMEVGFTERSLSFGGLMLASFVLGWMISCRSWLASSAWFAGSVLALSGLAVVVQALRRRWSPAATVLCGLIATGVLVGFVESLRPGPPTGVQLESKLGALISRGETLHPVDVTVPEIAFFAGCHLESLDEDALLAGHRPFPLWIVTHPALDLRLHDRLGAERIGRSFTLDSLGRRLVLRRLLPPPTPHGG